MPLMQESLKMEGVSSLALEVLSLPLSFPEK
jgi:hypothetical protein